METCRMIAEQDRAGHRKLIAEQMPHPLEDGADK